MTVRLRTSLLTAPAAIGAVVVLAAAAFASTTISITSSQVPTTASAFGGDEDCSFPELASQSPPLFGWHFVLPGGTATFDSLTAHFATAGDVTLPGPAGGFVQGGKGAVVYTSTDDTLTGAEATIEGTTPQGYFVLSNTCVPGTPTPTPSESVTPSGSASETPSASESASASETPSVSATATTTPTPEVSGTELSQPPSVTPSVLGVKLTKGGVAGTGLPKTGLSVLGLLSFAGLLVAAGVALLQRPKGRYAR